MGTRASLPGCAGKAERSVPAEQRHEEPARRHDIATLFLDNALRVRLFTTGSNRIFKLIPGDAGRPIPDIASDLLYPELAEDVRQVLRTLVFHDKQIAVRHGRWFVVRIMPYRSPENMIDGALITFADLTLSKTLEAVLWKSQVGLEKRIVAQEHVETLSET